MFQVKDKSLTSDGGACCPFLDLDWLSPCLDQTNEIKDYDGDLLGTGNRWEPSKFHSESFVCTTVPWLTAIASVIIASVMCTFRRTMASLVWLTAQAVEHRLPARFCCSLSQRLFCPAELCRLRCRCTQHNPVLHKKSWDVINTLLTKHISDRIP